MGKGLLIRNGKGEKGEAGREEKLPCLDKVPEVVLNYVKLIITPLLSPLYPFPGFVRSSGFQGTLGGRLTFEGRPDPVGGPW